MMIPSSNQQPFVRSNAIPAMYIPEQQIPLSPPIIQSSPGQNTFHQMSGPSILPPYCMSQPHLNQQPEVIRPIPNPRQLPYPGPTTTIQQFSRPISIYPHFQIEPPSLDPRLSTNSAAIGLKRLLAEMKAKQFDTIRFAAYRTASKLRYIQQRTLVGLLELARVVDVFRDLGLHQPIDQSAASLDYVSTARLLDQLLMTSSTNHAAPVTCSSTLAGTPPGQAAAVDMLLGWLVYAYDANASGRLAVNSLKIALSTMANAKPVDKFRYHFTLLSDPSGALIPAKFDAYLQDLLKLPCSVFEGPNFFYTPQAGNALFTGRSKSVLLEEFLDRMQSDPSPQILVWLTIFHRLATVQNVKHAIRCEGCKREPIIGLRYKCTRCQHYNLCQDCFWTGVTTDQHSNSHDVKEYSSAGKSHSRQFGHSLRKSFQFGRTNSTTTASANHHPVTDPRLASGGSTRSAVGGPFNSTRSVSKRRRPPIDSLFDFSHVSSSSAAATLVDNSQSNGQMTNVSVNHFQQASFANVLGSPLPNQRRFGQLSLPTPMATVNSAVLNPINQQHSLVMNAASNHQVARQMSQPTMTRNALMSPPPPVGGQLPNPGFFRPDPLPFNNQLFNQSSQATTFNALPGGGHAFTTTHFQPDAVNQSRSSLVTSTFPSSLATPRCRQQKDTACQAEHDLIAKHAAALIAVMPKSKQPNRHSFDQSGTTQTQRKLIAELQAKNRQILAEIERLRLEQQKQAAVLAAANNSNIDQSSSLQLGLSPSNGGTVSTTGQTPPKLLSELTALRLHKEELDNRMSNLQQNRNELTGQLETLVRLLTATGPSQGQARKKALSIASPTSELVSAIGAVDLDEDRQPSSLDLAKRLPANLDVDRRLVRANGGRQPPPRRSSSLASNGGSSTYVDSSFAPPASSSSLAAAALSNNRDLGSEVGRIATTINNTSKPLMGRQLSALSAILPQTHHHHNDLMTKSLLKNEAFLEKLEALLRKKSNKLQVVTTDDDESTRGAYQTLSPAVSRRFNSHRHSNQDNGSDACLYSDPENCATGSVSRRRSDYSRSRLTSSSIKVSSINSTTVVGNNTPGTINHHYNSSFDAAAAASSSSSGGQAYSDNYEYPAFLSNEPDMESDKIAPLL